MPLPALLLGWNSQSRGRSQDSSPEKGSKSACWFLRSRQGSLPMTILVCRAGFAAFWVKKGLRRAFMVVGG